MRDMDNKMKIYRNSPNLILNSLHRIIFNLNISWTIAVRSERIAEWIIAGIHNAGHFHLHLMDGAFPGPATGASPLQWPAAPGAAQRGPSRGLNRAG